MNLRSTSKYHYLSLDDHSMNGYKSEIIIFND